MPSDLDSEPQLLAAQLARLESQLSHFFALVAQSPKREEAELAACRADASQLVERLRSLHPGVDAGLTPATVRTFVLASAAQDRGRFMVLVVDDELEQRELIQELLAPYFNVLLAANGAEGARLAKQHRPDVVLSDLTMPEEDGFGFLSLMRRDEMTEQIPLLIMSGVCDTDAKVRAFEGGAFDYLTKPVVGEELIARIRNALARSEMLRHERILQSTDDLTGLGNRRAFRSSLLSLLQQASRARSELSVVMMDQDGLKHINDVYGHAAGDQAIRAVAKALAACKRGRDCAARLGGDEFAVAMPDAGQSGAQAFIARVEEELRRNPIDVGEGLQLQLTVSFGVASFSEMDFEETDEHLLDRADKALYQSKRSRPSRSVVQRAG